MQIMSIRTVGPLPWGILLECQVREWWSAQSTSCSEPAVATRFARCVLALAKRSDDIRARLKKSKMYAQMVKSTGEKVKTSWR